MTAPFAINGRFYAQPVSGVQRYARQVVSAMDASLAGTANPPTLILPPGTPAPALDAIVCAERGKGTGHAWEQASLPLSWKGPLLNLCNTAPAVKAGQVVCIHDANVFKMPESYGRGFRAVYRTLQPLLARRSARIATVSRDSARQIAAHLPIDAADIAVLPNGHEHALAWDPTKATVFAHHPQDRPFVLALGSRARHKNLALLLTLATDLDALGLDLLVAGGEAGIFATEATGPAAPNVRLLGKVGDDDLAALLGRATCLAFPSFTEGFGLPIVEAMALGCPVVSSDRASMPEVCGDAALMAAPDDPAAWMGHFRALAASPALGERLAGMGREQVRKFSWVNTADGYLDLMAEACKARVRRPRPAAVAHGPLPTVAVCVATKGRPSIVEATVRHLVATQTHAPLDVVVSVSDPADAGSLGSMPGVRVVTSQPGLAAQRNAALDAIDGGIDVVAFFDDDFVADPGWLGAAAAFFRDEADAACVTGDVLADDVKGLGIPFDEAVAIVAAGGRRMEGELIEGYSPYGCNMAFRRSSIDGMRFDERLVLYGWLEDRDFGAALANRGGRCVKIAAARGVHMGSKGGRLGGDRLGYSQVVNPFYMNRKGTMRFQLVAGQLFRNIASNAVLSLRPEPHVDRIGRLRGNLRGLSDVMRGRFEPERAIRHPTGQVAPGASTPANGAALR